MGDVRRVRSVRTHPAVHPLAVVPETVLAGRERETGYLRALLERPAAHTRVVSVAGDAGIGKSRLITECLRDTDRRVLAAGSAEVALPVLADLMAGADPAGGGAGRQGGSDLRDGLARLVTEPAVLVLDDMHRAPVEATDLLDALLASPPAVPLVLVVGYRPASAPAGLLGALASGVATGAVAELVLGPLDDAAVAELAGDRCATGTLGGNPRWIRFATGGVADEVVVRAELAALPAQHLRLLRSLAVFGTDVGVSLLGAVSSPDDAAALGALLADLTATGMVVYDDLTATARFRQARIRELVYAGIDPAARAVGHRDAARARHDAGEPVERLAPHLAHLGGDLTVDDVRALLAAAGDVLWRSPAAAARWLDAALRTRADRWPPGTDRTRAAILLGRAQAMAGDLPAGRATVHEVLAGIRSVAPDQRWHAVAAAGLVERFLGRYPEAHHVLAGADGCVPSGEPALHHTVQHGLVALLGNRYPDAAGQVTDAALRSTPAAPTVRAAVLSVAGLGAATQVDVVGARGYLDEAAALVDASSDVALLESVETLSYLAWAESYLEQFDDARRHFRRGVALADGSGQDAVLPALLLGEAQIHLWTGSVTAAQAACDRAVELADAHGSDDLRCFATAIGAHVALWACSADDSAGAVAMAEEAVAAANPATLWGQTSVALLACAYAMTGQPDRCISTFLTMAGGIELTKAQPMYRTLWYRTLTGAATLAGDPAAAQDFAGRAAAHANEELPSHRALRAAARADGLASFGRLDEALPGYQQAAAEFDSCGWTLQRDWTLTACGALLVALGRSAEAVNWLHRGRAGAQRAGVRATVSLADTALRMIEPAAVDAGGLGQLTPRQREIAEMVMAGHSNRDVAERLSLSSRTVETHLANAYRSLGITSRAELTTLAGPRIRLLRG